MGESSKNSKIRYFCNLCDKDYASIQNVKNHIVNIHNNAENTSVAKSQAEIIDNLSW